MLFALLGLPHFVAVLQILFLPQFFFICEISAFSAYYYYFLIYFIYYAIIVVPFFLPFIFLHLVPRFPSSFLLISSCSWVIHVSSSASPLLTLFLTSPCLFCSYYLCFLFPVPFPPFSSLSTDNPPCDLYFCDSVQVLVVCLVHFCFCFCFRFSC